MIADSLVWAVDLGQVLDEAIAVDAVLGVHEEVSESGRLGVAPLQHGQIPLLKREQSISGEPSQWFIVLGHDHLIAGGLDSRMIDVSDCDCPVLSDPK